MTLISFERNIIRPVNIPTSGTCHSERKEKALYVRRNYLGQSTKARLLLLRILNLWWGPLQVVVSFSFLVYLFTCDNSVLFRYCLVQRPFRIFCSIPTFNQEFSFFFAFSQSLIGNFLLLLSLNLWLGIFFFCFLSIFDWELSFLFCFLLKARMGILTLGQGLWWVGILAQGL